ncbi:MAG: NTP transferase domain-containing protein [Holophaga sp.]|nr:NTP transferase domain-containing protein [Holophaga sp.]
MGTERGGAYILGLCLPAWMRKLRACLRGILVYTWSVPSQNHPSARVEGLTELGMLLLTGGESRRFGAPKHLQPHATGGSWAGHLVRIFEEVFPGAPIRILGTPVQERPELGSLEDSRLGPAHALACWAAEPQPRVLAWWVLACDQVHWTPQSLRQWHAQAQPELHSWVLGNHEGRLQYLGGFLGAELLPRVAEPGARSLRALASRLPCRVLPVSGVEWLDVDHPEDLAWR